MKWGIIKMNDIIWYFKTLYCIVRGLYYVIVKYDITEQIIFSIFLTIISPVIISFHSILFLGYNNKRIPYNLSHNNMIRLKTGKYEREYINGYSNEFCVHVDKSNIKL